jgi:hypothetical protein
MASTRVLDCRGLWTTPSVLKAEPGYLSTADNCVIDASGKLRPRRGFEYLGRTFGSGSSRANALFGFNGTLLVQYDDKLAYDSGSAITDYTGTNTPPDPTSLRMAAEEASQSLFVTTSQGVKAIDTPIGGTPTISGMPRGAPPDSRGDPLRKDGTPNAGWMPEDSQSAYVATWSRVDANEVIIEGAPSTAVYVVNPKVLDFVTATTTVVRASNVVTFQTSGQVLVDDAYGFAPGDEFTIDADFAGSGGTLNGTFTLTQAFVDANGNLVLRWNQTAADITGSFTAGTLSSGTKNVGGSVILPTYVDTAYTYNVYRTRSSASNQDVPRQQYYLCYERQISSADVTAGFFTWSDERPDSLLGEPLYTNADDGEPPDSSLQNDNNQAPLCTDLETFDSRLWGANYEEFQALTINLLGVGSPDGLQPGDTITIGGVTYTGIATSSAFSTTEFWVYDDALPATATATQPFGLYYYTPSERVFLTARNLGYTVARNASTTVDCFYTSGVDDIPGQMLLRGRTPSTAQFSVYASRTTAWSPILTTSSTGAVTSTADESTNGLWYSKQNQPHSVPLLNRLPVGPRNCRILRIRALRDKLFVFTDIAGIWTVSNTYPYAVDRLSKTVALVGADTLVDFDDSLYCLTTRGVARVDESGVGIISLPIYDDLREHFGEGLETLETKALAVGYESEAKYILFMPTEVADTENNQAFVFDTITRGWTRWTKEVNAAVVLPQDNYLYVAGNDDNEVSVERKSFDRTDYSDESFSVTISSTSGTAVTLADASEVSVGDLLYQDPVAQALVTAVDGNVVTTLETVTWATGAATVYKAYECKAVWTPLVSNAPEEWKHYREVQFHFETPGFSLGGALFAADVNPQEQEVEVDFEETLGGFGIPAWEDFAWGQPSGPQNKRAGVPTECQHANYLSVGLRVTEARGSWSLTGFTAVYEGGSERGTE